MKIDLIDVFGAHPMTGNPLAVVHGGEALSTDQMLALTRWLNFSETTFLLPPTEPGADYRVRIFYPGGELPFAGHPTLGSAFAWLTAGGTPATSGRIVQQCGVGLVELRMRDDLLAFKAPPLLRSGPLSSAERAHAAQIANVPEDCIVEAVHACNGPGWQLLRLRSAADVLAAEPVARAALGTDIGLVGPHEAGSSPAFEVRAFFANQREQLIEDPVTGSLNAAIAQYLFANDLAKGSYVAAQGQKIGTDGLIHCTQDGEAVWIGGRTAMISAGGALTLPEA